ncbi:MAG: tRNA (guanosine(37)-N1)-methyltransferase TrmD [Cyanobacteria bacterium J06626_23]
MRFDIISLFPDFYTSPLQSGLMGKALSKGIAEVHLTNPRDFTHDKHRKVDDEPYGGGAGMVMKVAPVIEAVESLPVAPSRQVILLTPQGEPMTQQHFHRWTQYQQLVLICGHYEGIDERVATIVTQEISLGDFVLTSGDIPALTLINGVIRLLPGTVGKAASWQQDSFEDGLLDYPHYTRPVDFRGQTVPAVLRSGNHAAIAQWRRQQQLERTQQRRPDLYARWRQTEPEPDAQPKPVSEPQTAADAPVNSANETP